MATLKDLLIATIGEHRPLTRAESHTALNAMLGGDASDVEIAALLTSIAVRGETADELTGFAEAMRALAVPLPLTEAERAQLVDTCGTGGDGMGTFNISTAAALVAAAAGARVAKHGNRGVTSKCGSADVLEALGVPVDLPPAQAVECLRATGFMFLYAPLLHPAMKRVQPVRRALGFRTIFNLAGPLTNPAGAQAQVMGVFAEDKLVPVAEAMSRLGIRSAMAVHARDGLDEIGLCETDAVVVNEHNRLSKVVLAPEEAGLPPASIAELRGGSTAEESAAMIQSILHGASGPRRDIVLLNAAAALRVAGLVADLREGVERCADAVDSGAAVCTLAALRQVRQEQKSQSRV